MDGATAMQMPRRRLNVDAVTVAKRFFFTKLRDLTQRGGDFTYTFPPVSQLLL